MKNENVFFFRPGTQHENSGDALINRSAVDYLNQYGNVFLHNPKLEESYIKYIAGNNSQILNKSSFTFYFKAVKEKLKYKNNNVWLVFPPGDVGRKGWKSFLFGIRLYLICVVVKLMGVKLCRLGFSLSSFDTPNFIAHGLWGKLFTLYGVRDNLSLAKAKKMGIKKAVLFPDFSLIHKVKLQEKYKVRSGVAISIRTIGYGGQGQVVNEDNIAKNLVNCKWLSNENLSFFHQVKYDKVSVKSIYKTVSRTNSACLLHKKIQPHELADFFVDFKLVITNRLHVALYALKSGCIPIILASENNNIKINSLFKDIGIEELLNFDDLNDKINYINNDLFRNKILAKSNEILLNQHCIAEKYGKEFFNG